MNLPTHGHGQGYTDLNFLIPELVQRVDYEKGVYYADEGDFSSAGAANLVYFDDLPTQHRPGRGRHLQLLRAGCSPTRRSVGDGKLLYALELFHDDGPWEHPDGFKKLQRRARATAGATRGSGWSLTALRVRRETGTRPTRSPKRAIDAPGFGRFDSLDDTTGGKSQKYMLYGEWHRSDDALRLAAPRLRLLPGPRPVLELHLLPRQPRGRPVRAARRPLGGRRQGRSHLLRAPLRAAHGEHGRPPGTQRLRSATGCSRPSDAAALTKLDYEGGELPSTTRRDSVWETQRRALPRELASSGTRSSARCWACGRTTSTSTSTATSPRTRAATTTSS